MYYKLKYEIDTTNRKSLVTKCRNVEISVLDDSSKHLVCIEWKTVIRVESKKVLIIKYKAN